ncbi:flagellin [Yoonia sp. SS1-5]|uniref:Flagellin n=1 Tax=Yoonia rhodophyticola TaxID=3137370 RepID=A0AAN0MKZ6_9RHOB
MPVTSVGDMAQQFVSMRNGGRIKTDLSQLAQSLSTGRVTDVTATLGGETARLSGINYTLNQLESYEQVSKETTQTLSGIQTILSQVNSLRAQTSEQLLLLSDESNPSQIDEAGRASRETFNQMIATLNTRVADRSLLSGSAVEAQALADGDDMIADMIATLGGATTSDDILQGIDTWFDDPAGGFETMGYLGDRGPDPEKRLSDTKSLVIDARANDAEIINLLKAAAVAAIADELPTIDLQTKSTLLQSAGRSLFAAADGMVDVQARIGFSEANIARWAAELNAEKTALQIAKNDMISADPFDTASRLQSAQLQLETHYSVTARMSRISLLDYI